MAIFPVVKTVPIEYQATVPSSSRIVYSLTVCITGGHILGSISWRKLKKKLSTRLLHFECYDISSLQQHKLYSENQSVLSATEEILNSNYSVITFTMDAAHFPSLMGWHGNQHGNVKLIFLLDYFINII